MVGVVKNRGKRVSCLDFSEAGMGQLASKTGIWVPTATWRLRLDQKQFVEAPFSTKSHPKLSRLKVTLESNTVWNIFKSTEEVTCSKATAGQAAGPG